MFRSNLNSDLPLDVLRDLKRSLTEQRTNYINLLTENRRMIETIDNCIYSQEMRQATINTNTNTNINANSISDPNARTLTNEQIFRYTTALIYGEIENPMNNICYITGRTFRNDEPVCKLPCGHLFDGNAMMFHLTRNNSRCPACNACVIPESERLTQQPQQTQPHRPQTRQRPQTQIPIRTYTQSPLTFSHPLNLTSISSSLLNAAFFNNSDLMSSYSSENDDLLTDEEIENATEILYYDEIENPISDHCPISYTEFEPHTSVCVIKHCQHIFQPSSLKEWLSRNNTCPVCRYNLKGETNTHLDTSGNIYDTSGNLNGGIALYYTIIRR